MSLIETHWGLKPYYGDARLGLSLRKVNERSKKYPGGLSLGIKSPLISTKTCSKWYRNGGSRESFHSGGNIRALSHAQGTSAKRGGGGEVFTREYSYVPVSFNK